MTRADTGMKGFQERLGVLKRQIAQLSGAGVGVETYFRSFLEQVVAVLGVGGGIWRVQEGAGMACVCHMNLSMAGLGEDGRQVDLVGRMAGRVVESGQAVVLAGNDASNVFDGGLGAEGTNDSVHTLIAVPMIESGEVAVVLVLIAPEGVDPRAVRGFAGFLVGLCGQAGGFLERKRIEDLRGEIAQGQRLREYVSALHSSLDPRRTCYALANYGQELLGVYRCMAGTYNAWGKFRMQAVSGLESVAVKSGFVQTVSAIAKVVCMNGKALLVDSPSEAQGAASDADDLLTAARLYMLQAEIKVMGVFPVTSGDEVVGALVVEKAQEEPIDQGQRQRVETLLVEAGTALNNCLAYRSLPFSAALRAAGALRRKIYRMPGGRRVVWAAILMILISLPFVIQKDVTVIGTAELVPVAARTVYAQQDGVIESLSPLLEELLETRDKLVQQGDLLALMDTRGIDSLIDKVASEISETDIAIDAAIDVGDEEQAVLLKLQFKTLQAQLKMYTIEHEKYDVRANVSGRIITRQSVLKQLLGKPVARGQALLEIVPEDTSWELTVNVPEDEAGPLLLAYDGRGEEPLSARVILHMFPDFTLETEVVSVAARAHVMSTGERKYRNVIEVRVAQPEGLLEYGIDPRQGMEGKVAIKCDRRSVFYAVTHEFVNFLRINLF